MVGSDTKPGRPDPFSRMQRRKMMYSDLVIFRVCQKEKWLIPLCRGLQGVSPGRCLVGNGGPWWPEMASEGGGAVLWRRCCWSATSPEEVAVMLEWRRRWWWLNGGTRWPESRFANCTVVERENGSSFDSRERQRDRERREETKWWCLAGIQKLDFSPWILHSFSSVILHFFLSTLFFSSQSRSVLSTSRE